MPLTIRRTCRYAVAHRKTLALIVCGFAILLLAIFWLNNTPEKKFEDLCNTILVEELSEDALSLHYTLSSPADYGIQSSESGLPVYSYEQTMLSAEQVSDKLTALQEIDPNALSDSNQITYHLLKQTLENDLATLPFLYYSDPLSPSSGMQSQLPILLSEYSLSNREDIEAYLRLLTNVPAYLEGLLTFEKEKAAVGLSSSKESLVNSSVQCNEIMDAASLDNNTHFLLTSFSSRLDSLVSKGVISKQDRIDYELRNHEILTETLLPAYQNLSETLLTLSESAGASVGLCQFPNGRDYYLLLVAQKSGSSKSILEISSLLRTSFASDYQELVSLVSQINQTEDANDSGSSNDTTISETISSSGQFVFAKELTSPEEMLYDLQEKMLVDFPLFPNTEQEISHEVKAVDTGMEGYVSPAFYLVPPIDKVDSNTIYINYGLNPDPLSLYTTLAHEGYPGHLYQSVYFLSGPTFKATLPIRGLLHYGGYIEGYATYAELYSYDYAKTPQNENYCDMVRLNRKLHLALYSLLDIAIHYNGATEPEVSAILSSFGIADETVAKAIYEYIVSEPGTYLKYYLGYLELLECKELAKECWGTFYSEQTFHQFFLSFGPADYDTIKTAIRNQTFVLQQASK